MFYRQPMSTFQVSFGRRHVMLDMMRGFQRLPTKQRPFLMQHFILPTSDPQWNKILQSCDHDFYNLSEYVELEANREGGQGIGIVFEEKEKIVFFQFILKALPEEFIHVAPGIRDAISPYGYPGLVFSRECKKDDDFKFLCICNLLEIMKEMSIVCAFIRLNPMFPFSKIEDKNLGIVTVDHFSTVWIDLLTSKEEVIRNTRKTHKNLISRARREGFVAREDKSLKHLDTFGRIYRKTMKRLGAAEMYLFDDNYFHGLSKALEEHFHLWVVEKENELAAAGIFSDCNGIVQYHLSGTEEKFERVSPTRLMISEVRDWAIEKGNRAFHLGGGLGSKEDGLYKFKAGFSKSTAVFQTMRLIAKKEDYNALLKIWEKYSGKQSDSVSGYFPAFRKNIV